MLRTHLLTIINDTPRLIRVLGVDRVDDSTDWQAISDRVQDGVLSSGETALAQCLCALGGAQTPEGFGEHFNWLDGRDMEIIVLILWRETEETREEEQAGREFLGLTDPAT